MTQEREAVKRMAEFRKLFLELNEKGQETALAVLRSLGFAQSVVCLQENGQPYQSSGQEAASHSVMRETGLSV